MMPYLANACSKFKDSKITLKIITPVVNVSEEVEKKAMIYS